ncbi:MAG: GNAT family N-acetyltransferase [Saprospiraceae bacterium]
MLTLATLENTSLTQITNAFNEAFSDYYFPISFTEQKFADKFKTEGGRLDLSVGVFENDDLVAFILHFIDDKEGVTYIYNGGTGVVPTHRGNGLTAKMHAFIEPIIKEVDVSRMVLEVLTQNAPAIKVYKKQGYRIGRELWCFSGSLKKQPNTTLAKGYDIINLAQPDWKRFQTFWDFSPTWQNSISTLKNLTMDFNIIGIVYETQLVGYLIYSPKHKRVHHLAVAKTHRQQGIGGSLLRHLFTLEKSKISMINIDTRIAGMKHLLESHGLENFSNQYEMEKAL